MKKTTQKLIEYSIAGLGLCTLVFLIAFENNAGLKKRCTGVNVELVGGESDYFISGDDIVKAITKNGMQPIEGKLLSQISLSEVEKDVLKIKQIQSCEVFGDLQGHVNIKAKPYLPYARILRPESIDCYMDDNGGFFPLSKYHSARVLLLSGDYFKARKKLDPETDADLIALIRKIKEDAFWNAQISRVEVDKEKSLKLVTVLGDQEVNFGKPSDAEQKLNKLLVFYKSILPSTKWSQFEKIDIQYKNQIVCKNN